MRHECYRLCPSSGCFIEEMSLLGDGFVESSAFSRPGFLAAGADALEASSTGGCHRHEQDYNRGGNENHWPNLRIRSHVVCHPLCASDHPSSWCRSHQSWSFQAEALRLKGCVVLAGLLVIFGFITDLGSRCSIRICQNVTMITLSVAGLLLLLNVVLISSILSVDQLIGWGSIDVLAANHLKIVLVFVQAYSVLYVFDFFECNFFLSFGFRAIPLTSELSKLVKLNTVFMPWFWCCFWKLVFSLRHLSSWHCCLDWINCLVLVLAYWLSGGFCDKFLGFL